MYHPCHYEAVDCNVKVVTKAAVHKMTSSPLFYLPLFIAALAIDIKVGRDQTLRPPQSFQSS